MKKNLYRILLSGLFVILSVIILTREVNTRQGIDYDVYTKKIPLYLKLLDFYDRHFNYAYLVKKIIDRNDDSSKRAIKLLSWVYYNLNDQPQTLPVIDDHVWHIVVRGYGTAEQFSDVFSTLCTYAGMPAFFSHIHSQTGDVVTLSFIRMGRRQTIFDPYRGVYFENSAGVLADINDIAAGDWKPKTFAALRRPRIEYTQYFNNISADMRKYDSTRPQIQSPWQRFMFEISKLWKHD